MVSKKIKLSPVIAFFSVFVLFLSSCKKDKEDVVQAPVVTFTELGSGNNKKATIGSDFHIEAEVLANGLIQKIDLVILEKAGSFSITKSYTDATYAGVRNATFHEHVDIPANTPAGVYTVKLSVTDKTGQTTTAEAEITIEQQKAVAALVFTELSGGESLYPHGDHFHGLAGAVDGKSVTVTFGSDGNAITNGHLHLEAEGFYRVELKTFDEEGKETQTRFIANEVTAANYKAFLVGGDFVLNPDAADETGAIFQTRETKYADGADITGGAVNTTGVISYFTMGHSNEEGEKDMIFVMRRLNDGVKPTITRVDWNRTDYATAFAGTNELELKFEIHAGEH